MSKCIHCGVSEDKSHLPSCPRFVQPVPRQRRDLVNAPSHYGGAVDPYEAIKVIEAWGLGFNEGNAVKYIKRGEDKDTKRQNLLKAIWYLKREVWIMDGAPGEFERDTKICRDEPTQVK